MTFHNEASGFLDDVLKAKENKQLPYKSFHMTRGTSQTPG